ncbi:MAG: hypothetical protein H8E39_08730 [Alphaproteobacteria bacterium]|nr:hypothetical protein [Alphaproteobacteria bacterium]
MAIEQVLATAISGLQVSAKKAEVSATNIVNQNTVGYKVLDVHPITRTSGIGSGTGNSLAAQLFEGGAVDVATEFTRLIEAEVSYKANARVIQTAEDLQRALLDITA